MSDEGQEKKKKREVIGNDDFARAISKIAVAQICDTAGFHTAKLSALDALADIAIRYVLDLGRAAHFYAAQSGRTDCNVFDLVQGLNDLSSSHGFKHCLVGSDVVYDIVRYVGSAKEVPFACPVPKFSISRPVKTAPSFAGVGEAPAGKHIPDWLPAFPDLHTYVHTPVWNERASDARADKLEQARQQRKAERSLLSLQQRLACNGAIGLFPEAMGDANPFLAQPLLDEEKDAEEIAVTDEAAIGTRLPVLETFAPVIEAVTMGSSNSGISERRVPHTRTKVHFRFGIDKKSVAVPLSSIAPGMKTDILFMRDDEKDDRKRRAEMILKEAMENPEELTQL